MKYYLLDIILLSQSEREYLVAHSVRFLGLLSTNALNPYRKIAKQLFFYHIKVEFDLEISSNFKSTEHFSSKFRKLLVILYR